MVLRIRDLKKGDYEAVCRIFQQGIDGGNATFQTRIKSWTEWDQAYFKDCRLSLLEGDKIMGYAVLSPFSSIAAYHGVAEVSIYLDQEIRGCGAGKLLLSYLIEASEKAGYWTLLAKIFVENRISIHIHEQQDFRIIGRLEKIGRLAGKWRDVIIMERRSDIM